MLCKSNRKYPYETFGCIVIAYCVLLLTIVRTGNPERDRKYASGRGGIARREDASGRGDRRISKYETGKLHVFILKYVKFDS